MRIKYKILWVDDRKDDFEKLSYGKYIVDYVRDLFFEPDLTFCETINEAKGKISQDHYDVIFSDFNIDGTKEEQGDTFISYIRSRNVNTEVLFYSAMEELPIVKLDRVMFFSLAGIQNGYRELLERMKKLIVLTTEKLNDTTALRGLVMAETSELDKKMEEICLSFFVQNKTDKSDTVFEEILKGLEKDYLNKLDQSTQCDKNCTHKIRKLSSIEGIITNMAFDSSRKARAIKKIMEEKMYTYNDYNIDEFYESYLKDIIGIRNLLAHSYSKINEEGTEVLVSKKDGNEIVFDKNKIKEIRQRILLYEKMLDDLYHRLNVNL